MMVRYSTRAAAQRICKAASNVKTCERKLHALGRDAIPPSDLVPFSKEWDFHLVETSDMAQVCELILASIASNSDEYGVGGGESIFNSPFIKIGMRWRSRDRLSNPTVEISSNSLVVAATVKGTSKIAAIVEIKLLPEGDHVPFLSNPFRSKETDPTYQPCLFNLCVRESHRNKGLGKLMCQIVQEIAFIKWKKDIMYLHVLQGNLAARKLYINLGYKQITNNFENNWDLDKGEQALLYSCRLKSLFSTVIEPPSPPEIPPAKTL